MNASLNTEQVFGSYANAATRYSSVKAEIQGMEGSSDPVFVDKLALLKAEAAQLHQEMTRLFFSEHPQNGFLGEAQVTRLYAVDPSNHQADHCLYLNPSDPVHLQVGAHEYQGTADQVEQWAQAHGLLTQFHRVSVAV